MLTKIVIPAIGVAAGVVTVACVAIFVKHVARGDKKEVIYVSSPGGEAENVDTNPNSEKDCMADDCEPKDDGGDDD